ncbi:MAG: cysteine hydrolase [Lachnospiraceae bacterium]|nr:cysteine hydrolase [Lachnospiraceae bacterium]
MKNTALVVIDLQNDITKNYKKIIGQVNEAIDWAVANEMHIIYIKHYNLSEKTRTFKPETKGAELVPELKVVTDNIFEKSKASALTSEAFAGFIEKNRIEEFYITGADATACVKSTSYNLAKAGYKVHVISDCVTSYDLKKLDEMFTYYETKGCDVLMLEECIREMEA